jgi:diacylglycerol kinase family enzyme
MIGVILNPNARGVKGDPGLRDRLARLLPPGTGEVYLTRTPDELAEACAELAAREARLVATCGGDGTNLSVITALARAYGRDRLPTLALLRGGTVNTVAANLGVHGRPEALLARLVPLAREREIPSVGQDLIDVNGQLGFLFAAAMGARFLEAYYGGPISGPLWAGALATRTVASSAIYGKLARWLFAPLPMELRLDGEPIAEPAAPRLLVAGTIADVGIGMRVLWQAGRQPNRFHVVASGISTVAMARQLHRVRAGRPLAGAPHLDRLAQRLDLRFAGPESFTLDGELFREREVTITVGPRVWISGDRRPGLK